MNSIKIACACVIALSIAPVSNAANLAADDASDPAYSGGWTNGSNGGYGFGAWQLTPGVSGSTAGHFVASSTLNGDGFDDGNVNGAPGDGDIDTFVSVPVSWGMYANNDASAIAIRPFTGGPLANGQTFAVDFDHGLIDSADGRFTLGFLDEDYMPIFSLIYIGGTPEIFFIDAITLSNVGFGYGDEGFSFSMTMTGVTNYNATLTRNDGAVFSWSGAFRAVPESFFAINQNTAGPFSGAPYDFFINSMSIVPEPSTIALAALGVIGVAGRYLRRRED